MDSEDPLSGWSVKEVLLNAPPAKNDIYGSLFNHIQRLLFEFCHRIKTINMRFQFVQLDALKLPDLMEDLGKDKAYFDRIEVRRELLA